MRPIPSGLARPSTNRATRASLAPVLQQALSAGSWQEREEHLSRAYEYLAAWHNELGITEMLPEKTTPFFGRPFRVIWGGKFSNAICARITDPTVRCLTRFPLIGSIDQFSDNTDLLSDPRWRLVLRKLWLAEEV